MTQTFMDTMSFQVIVTLTIAICIVGISAAVYNGIRYNQISKYNKSESPAESTPQVGKINIITGIIFGLSFLVIVAILIANLNKSNCIDMDRGNANPEVGTAKDLADLFE